MKVPHLTSDSYPETILAMLHTVYKHEITHPRAFAGNSRKERQIQGVKRFYIQLPGRTLKIE